MRKAVQKRWKKVLASVILLLVFFILLFFFSTKKADMPTPIPTSLNYSEPVDLFIERLCTIPVGLVRVGVAASVQKCSDDLFLVHEISILPDSASFLVTRNLATIDVCQSRSAPEGCKRIEERGCQSENLCKNYAVNCTDFARRSILTQKYCDSLVTDRAS